MWGLKVEEYQFTQYFGNDSHLPVFNVSEEEVPDETFAVDYTPEPQPEHDKQDHYGSEIADWMGSGSGASQAAADASAFAIGEAGRKKAEELMSKTAFQAGELIETAKQKAESIIEEARKAGFDAGYEDGKAKAFAEMNETYKKALDDTYGELLNGLSDAAVQMDQKKKEITKTYLKDLTEVAVTVAEKVVNVSLRSSGKIIERMILSAVEQSGSHQWARVLISEKDATLMRQSGINIEKTLQRVADRVKVVVIENGAPGTCYVEFPNKIIDAGVETQLQNIRELVAALKV